MRSTAGPRLKPLGRRGDDDRLRVRLLGDGEDRRPRVARAPQLGRRVQVAGVGERLRARERVTGLALGLRELRVERERRRHLEHAHEPQRPALAGEVRGDGDRVLGLRVAGDDRHDDRPAIEERPRRATRLGALLSRFMLRR